MNIETFKKWLYKNEPVMRPLPKKQENKGKKLSGKELLKTREIPDYKTCKICGRWLPAEMFSYAPNNKDGLNTYCRECHNAKKVEARAMGRKIREEKKANKAKNIAKKAKKVS